MKRFVIRTLLYVQLVRESCVYTDEKVENMSLKENFERYLRTRVQDLIENEGRKSHPHSIIDPLTLNVSALARKRTRYFADLIASARDLTENRHLYNRGIHHLGIENFLSVAVQFCKDEARDGKIDIVSVGCGNGFVENNVKAAYGRCFGNSSRLNIILVDPDERYGSKVDFKYVDDLVSRRPDIVGNCVLFIFCPPPEASNDGFDIDSIRKLKPKAILSEYDVTGESGSRDFVQFLDPVGPYKKQYSKNCGLDSYPIKEIVLRDRSTGMDLRLSKIKK